MTPTAAYWTRTAVDGWMPTTDGIVLVVAPEEEGGPEVTTGYYDHERKQWYWHNDIAMYAPPEWWAPMPKPPVER